MKPIEHSKSLVEKVYDNLLEAICRGELLPGERLHHDELAERLGVSRQPINSALAILKSQQLIEDTGKRSVQVSKLDVSLQLQILEIREWLEPFAIRLTTERASKNDLSAIERCLEKGEKELRNLDKYRLVELDVAFHNSIYSATQNPIIEKMMSINMHNVRRFMSSVLSGQSAPVAVWNEHRQIFNSIESQDTKTGIELMKHHISHARDRLLKSQNENN